MEKQTVFVGRDVINNDGTVQDIRRPVEFEGEEIAQRTQVGTGTGVLDSLDSRGVTETLYRIADGRLVVHVKAWSQWLGEPTTESLHQVDEADLGLGGRFEALGREAGLGRPLTLEEALSHD